VLTCRKLLENARSLAEQGEHAQLAGLKPWRGTLAHLRGNVMHHYKEHFQERARQFFFLSLLHN
jgi:hypothetical protein